MKTLYIFVCLIALFGLSNCGQDNHICEYGLYNGIQIHDMITIDECSKFDPEESINAIWAVFLHDSVAIHDGYKMWRGQTYADLWNGTINVWLTTDTDSFEVYDHSYKLSIKVDSFTCPSLDSYAHQLAHYFQFVTGHKVTDSDPFYFGPDGLVAKANSSLVCE
jgi:hypothetical protein